MRPAPFLALACCASLPAFGQEWAKQDLQKSPRHQEWVDVARGGRSLKAFVVYPEAKKKTAAVVIIHENMGLTDWVRDLADQVAAAGYIAIAPDLLSGMAPGGGKTSDFPSVDAAREAIYKLDKDAVTADLNAVADLGEEAAERERQDRGGGLLLGRRPVVPLRHGAPRPRRGLRLLRSRSGRRDARSALPSTASTAARTRASARPSSRRRRR